MIRNERISDRYKQGAVFTTYLSSYGCDKLSKHHSIVSIVSDMILADKELNLGIENDSKWIMELSESGIIDVFEKNGKFYTSISTDSTRLSNFDYKNFNQLEAKKYGSQKYLIFEIGCENKELLAVVNPY